MTSSVVPMNAVYHRQQGIDIVSNQHHSDIARTTYFSHQRHNFLLVANIQVRQRLIEQEQSWVSQQSLGDQ